MIASLALHCQTLALLLEDMALSRRPIPLRREQKFAMNMLRHGELEHVVRKIYGVCASCVGAAEFTPKHAFWRAPPNPGRGRASWVGAY